MKLRLMMLVTLRRGKVLILVFLLASCGKLHEEKNNFEIRNEYLKKKYSYNYIREAVKDSLEIWKKDSLSVATSIIFYPYEIDSVFLFNLDSNTFFTTINESSLGDNRVKSDAIKNFAGRKINNKWYFFFMGVSEPVVRSYWQDSIYEPLTFEELSYVAYKQRFKTLVKNVNEGHPEKNDLIFKTRIFTELPECKVYPDSLKQHCHDSLLLASVSRKYKNKLQPEEIEDIKTAMAESKRPDGPQTNERTWWEKLEYGEKVFESKEWKEYLKNKQ